MPVLLVAGGDDVRFSAIAASMESAIGPNASTSIIPGSGHAAPFEDPNAFCAAVEAFLTKR
jgi:pimeloyl-ACP methyl ester carboxylesterase